MAVTDTSRPQGDDLVERGPVGVRATATPIAAPPSSQRGTVLDLRPVGDPTIRLGVAAPRATLVMGAGVLFCWSCSHRTEHDIVLPRGGNTNRARDRMPAYRCLCSRCGHLASARPAEQKAAETRWRRQRRATVGLAARLRSGAVLRHRSPDAATSR
jgi:hypothetical protein